MLLFRGVRFFLWLRSLHLPLSGTHDHGLKDDVAIDYKRQGNNNLTNILLNLETFVSSNAEDMFNNKSKAHIADSDTTDEEDELLRDLGRTSQNSRVDAKNRPKAKTQDRSKLVKNIKSRDD